MQTLFNIYLLLLVATMLFGLVRFKKLTGPFRMLVILILYTFPIELLNRGLISIGFENTFPIYHLSAVILITLNLTIYLNLFNRNSASRRLVIILSILCSFIAIINTIFHQDINTFPSFSIAAHAFQSIILTLLMFNEMIKSPVMTPILKQSVFWLNTGTFIFYSSNFVSLVLYNSYYKLDDIIVIWLLYLNWIGNMILYSCYLIALYFNQKSSR